jgi:hypothetical protein
MPIESATAFDRNAMLQKLLRKRCGDGFQSSVSSSHILKRFKPDQNSDEAAW